MQPPSLYYPTRLVFKYNLDFLCSNRKLRNSFGVYSITLFIIWVSLPLILYILFIPLSSMNIVIILIAILLVSLLLRKAWTIYRKRLATYREHLSRLINHPIERGNNERDVGGNRKTGLALHVDLKKASDGYYRIILAIIVGGIIAFLFLVFMLFLRLLFVDVRHLAEPLLYLSCIIFAPTIIITILFAIIYRYADYEGLLIAYFLEALGFYLAKDVASFEALIMLNILFAVSTIILVAAYLDTGRQRLAYYLLVYSSVYEDPNKRKNFLKKLKGLLVGYGSQQEGEYTFYDIYESVEKPAFKKLNANGFLLSLVALVLVPILGPTYGLSLGAMLTITYSVFLVTLLVLVTLLLIPRVKELSIILKANNTLLNMTLYGLLMIIIGAPLINVLHDGYESTIQPVIIAFFNNIYVGMPIVFLIILIVVNVVLFTLEAVLIYSAKNVGSLEKHGDQYEYLVISIKENLRRLIITKFRWKAINVVLGIISGTFIMLMEVLFSLNYLPPEVSIAMFSIDVAYMVSLETVSMICFYFFAPIFGFASLYITELSPRSFIIIISTIYFSFVLALYLYAVNFIRIRFKELTHESYVYIDGVFSGTIRMYPNIDIIGGDVYSSDLHKFSPLYIMPLLLTIILTYFIILIKIYFPSTIGAHTTGAWGRPSILDTSLMNFLKGVVLSLVIIYWPIFLELQWYNKVAGRIEIHRDIDEHYQRLLILKEIGDPEMRSKELREIMDQLSGKLEDDQYYIDRLLRYVTEHGIVTGNSLRAIRTLVYISLTSLINLFIQIFGVLQLYYSLIDIYVVLCRMAGTLMIVMLAVIIYSIARTKISVFLKGLILCSAFIFLGFSVVYWSNYFGISVLIAVVSIMFIIDILYGTPEIDRYLQSKVDNRFKFNYDKELEFPTWRILYKLIIILMYALVVIYSSDPLSILIAETIILFEIINLACLEVIYRAPHFIIDFDESLQLNISRRGYVLIEEPLDELVMIG